jgi:starch synthase
LKVTLCLGSQSFQKQLAITLARRGMLSRALSFGPDPEIFDPDSQAGLKLIRRYPHYRLANRILWAAWRRLPMTSRSRNFPVVLTTAYLDRLLSRGLPPTDLFHGWTGLSMAGMRAVRPYRPVTMIENPSMHPRDWQNAVLRECGTWGVRPRDCHTLIPGPLMRRMEKEFALADFVVVPSTIAAASFARAGLGSKALVIHAGIDDSFFKPPESIRDNNAFRVCYAGRVDLGKGIVYLLKAWKMLALKDAELVLIGQVAAEMNALIREYASPGVRFEGLLPAAQLAEMYRNADVLAFPSVNEGLARVLLEAMASGLPVVATDCSGAADCVTPGVEGTVIPARDVDALAQALLWHYRNREATREMGKAARARVEAEFTVAHYEERMIRAYGAVWSTHPHRDFA